MTQLIDRVVDLLNRYGGRPTAEAIARRLLETGSWNFDGADPVRSVEAALAAEGHASEPRVIRFLDAYALRGHAGASGARIRGTPSTSPPADGAPPGRGSPDENPAWRRSRARHELTGEGPRLLLDLLQGPRLADHLDSRTVAALVRNDCAVVQNRWVSATAGARAVMRRHLITLGHSSRGRAAALFPAIAELVDCIPAESEIPLESGSVAAADLLIALYDAAMATRRRLPGDPTA